MHKVLVLVFALVLQGCYSSNSPSLNRNRITTKLFSFGGINITYNEYKVGRDVKILRDD